MILTMPRLSDSMEEGTIVDLLTADDSRVEENQEIAEIETDKAVMPYESEFSGTITWLVEIGDTIAVGEPIAEILASGEESSLTNTANNAEEETAPVSAPTKPDLVQAIPTKEPTVKISPLARRIAREKAIDINSLTGSGPGGRIIKRDVLKSLSDNVDSQIDIKSPAVEIRQLTSAQKVIAERMTTAKQTIPHFYLTTEVDYTALLASREELKQQLEKAPSVNDIIVLAVSKALQEHPKLNASLDGENIIYHREVNIGIAVAGEDNLLVPVIKNVESKSLREIQQTSQQLIENAVNNKLGVQEMSEGTFTISNLGMFAVTEFQAVINPPQVAILAVGSITDTGKGKLTLSADHRVVYGADGAKFLQTLVRYLETPLLLSY